MKKGNKAQAGILSTILIILIILVSIVIIWNVVYFIVNSSSSKISADAFTTSFDVPSTKLYITGGVQVQVHRGSGKGSLTGLTFIFQKKNGETKTLIKNINLPNELETKTYDFSSTEVPFNNTDIAKISVVPVFGNNMGIQVDETTYQKDSLGNRTLDINQSSGLVSWWKFDGNMQDSVGTNHGQFYPNIIDDFEDGNYNGWSGSCGVYILNITPGYTSQYSIKINSSSGGGCAYKFIDVTAGQNISFACKGYDCHACVYDGAVCLNGGDGSINHGYVNDWTTYTTTINYNRINALIHLYSGGEGQAAYYDSISYTPAFTSGKNQQGYGFNGLSNYIQVPNSASLNFGPNKDFTIAFWIKSPSISGYPLSKKDMTNNNLGWGVFTYFPNSNAILKISYGGSPLMQAESTPVLDNNWHFVVFTVSRNSNAIVYVDGVAGIPISCLSWATFDLTNTNDLYIGRNIPDFVDAFVGSLDNVMIFNSSLSSSEVQALYNNQK